MDEITQKESKVLPEVLQEIVSRIVEVAYPRRLILFGSAARGEIGADSDVDILVVVQGLIHRRELSGKIYRNFHGIPIPVDVVVVTEEDVLMYGEKVGTVIRPALKEGIVIYEA